MPSLPRLPDSFAITLNLNDVPTLIPLRVQERSAERVKYAAEVSYDNDGERAVGQFTATISSGSDQPNINATFPYGATGHSSFDIRDMIARALGLKTA